MVHCVAFGCYNDKANPEKNHAEKITFHRFPKNPELRAKWEKAVRREGWEPNSSSVLCSIHFREEMIDRSSLSVVRLRENAVPEIFPGHPKHLQYQKKNEGASSMKRELEMNAPGPSVALDTESPTKKMRVELEDTKEKLVQARSRIKVLQQSKRRLEKKVQTLKDIINLLRKYFIFPEETE